MHGGVVTVNGKSEKTALARTQRFLAITEVHAGSSEEGPQSLQGSTASRGGCLTRDVVKPQDE